jgi:hypothetical protein
MTVDAEAVEDFGSPSYNRCPRLRTEAEPKGAIYNEKIVNSASYTITYQ